MTPARADQNAFSPFVAASWDRKALEAAIEAGRPNFQPPSGVTGITVPHHLLAADLVARGFWAASANRYERIVLLAPDHFRKVRGHFAVMQDDLETVFGPIGADAAAVDALLARPDLFEAGVDVDREHGIMSVAPFIRRFFPDTPLVAILASVNAPPQAWEEAARVLEAVVTDRTLLVQSTDYSHYLPLAEAIRRDQESLASIAATDLAAIGRLLQPGHMDSRAAQYVQMALQQSRLGGKPVILANRSSAEYGSDPGVTTSYVVTAFLKDPAAGSVLSYGDQQRIFIGGDTLLGRYLGPILRDERAVQAIADAVLAITGGAPLAVNLEGVLLAEPVVGLPAESHVMRIETAGPVLQRLNVIAAGLANNHGQDLGAEGLDASRAALSGLGILPLIHGEIGDLGAFRVLPLSFHRGRFAGPGVIETGADLEAACTREADPPLVALVHWGEEYTEEPTDAERDAAIGLSGCGVSLVVGAHSHKASPRIELIAGGATQMIFSLGNFLFDQVSERSSGALLEVRVFRQGTSAARLIPIPNLFEIGVEARTPAPRPHEPPPPSGSPRVAGRAKRS